MRLIPPLLLLLLMFAGAASAADYYVSTTGDNGVSGDLTHPWQNVSYATSQATAGDTIYLFNETWYNEECMFTNNGTAGNPITLTAYNGTPTLINNSATILTPGITEKKAIFGGYYDGSYRARQYINISGLTIKYYCGGVYTRKSSHVHVADCIFNIIADTSDTAIYIKDNCHFCSIDNCTITGGAHNSINIAGRYEVGDVWQQNAVTNTTITNCHISANTVHNLIDLCGNMTDIDILNNNLHNGLQAGLFTHQGFPTRVNFSNNVIHDTLYGIHIGASGSMYDSVFINNTIYNTSDQGVRAYYSMNCTFTDNEIYNTAKRGIYYGETGTFIENYIYDTTMANYRMGHGINTIRDPVYVAPGFDFYMANDGTAVIESTERKIMNIVSLLGNYTVISPRHYYFLSNMTISVSGTNVSTMTVSMYNITLKPDYAYLKDVSVTHESAAGADITNITVSSNINTNPTRITALMQNATDTYNVSVNGVYAAQFVSDAGAIMKYQYEAAWSPDTTFLFEWHSTATYPGAPDVANLDTTVGAAWVNHTWIAGVGSVTDSYNVSINDVWHNGTTNTYWNDTAVGELNWSTIAIFGWNNTGGISQFSESNRAQSLATHWCVSIWGVYYNLASPITITTKGYGDRSNLFSRPPTETDTNITTCFKMVVDI